MAKAGLNFRIQISELKQMLWISDHLLEIVLLPDVI
jgi:hypothetical protein